MRALLDLLLGSVRRLIQGVWLGTSREIGEKLSTLRAYSDGKGHRDEDKVEHIRNFMLVSWKGLRKQIPTLFQRTELLTFSYL